MRALRRIYFLLADLRLVIVLLLGIALFTLAVQVPHNYRIEVGQEDGVGSDLPLLTNIYATEHDALGNYRWTTGDSQIRLPGIGSRTANLVIRSAPVNVEMATQGPQSFELVLNNRMVGVFPLRTAGGVYRVLLPASNLSGDLYIALRSATHSPLGDVRTLGINLDWIQLHTAWGAIPAVRSMALWVVLIPYLWLIIRMLGYGPNRAQQIVLGCLPLAGLAALLDPPRWALGAEPALIAIILAGGLALALNRFGPQLLARCGIVVANWAWRALCLGTALIFALRYGGKLYPDSMPGDIGFHINRLVDTLRGGVFLISKNRGVEFPYPPALYVLLAPLTLWLDIGTTLQLVGALLDALSPILIYLIALHSGFVRDPRFALAAALCYGLCGAGFMPTWWNFSTHIFAQFTHLLLITFVVVALPHAQRIWQPPMRVAHDPQSAVWQHSSTLLITFTIVLQLLVYLGHFGFWLNTTTLVGLALLVALLYRGIRIVVLRPQQEETRIDTLRWAALWRFSAIVLCAQLLVVVFFYSAYASLISDQIQQIASGGLSGLAGRARTDPAILWQTLHDGLYQHVGLFPIPLALAGFCLSRGKRHVRVLLGGTLLIAILFALLPFVTGSTLATRWLMFSIWAIMVAAAACIEYFWRSGRVARIVVAAVGIYILWLSLALWLGALAWRIRPLEPF